MHGPRLYESRDFTPAITKQRPKKEFRITVAITSSLAYARDKRQLSYLGYVQ
ncbi:hypothetical protein WN55_06630 [Dufourea novaeangliae]|uniref:Uncharacterized protein n=1 Tax=Dufourea novaeangliae TaxID=178035 RepID=A0A154PQM2_DUFNO|nr:hypothetical protein WN55_06630 [Dufourea novaeangliae]